MLTLPGRVADHPALADSMALDENLVIGGGYQTAPLFGLCLDKKILGRPFASRRLCRRASAEAAHGNRQTAGLLLQA
jgi:hypothetical protein